MSGLYEALKRAEGEQRRAGCLPPDSVQASEILTSVLNAPIEVRVSGATRINAVPSERLIALTEPRSLGAEKFRALAARLEIWRGTSNLKSLQVISSVISEGKTLVAGNLAVTLAKSGGAKVLLVEGDLHRPTLGSLFGLKQLQGIGDWWAGRSESLTALYQLDDLQLWLLPAGKPLNQPSEVLKSARFTRAFAQLGGSFDWVVVDSTPMLPVVDSNLWSRLVDGSLLVVREGVAPVEALKKGLASLDDPKLIGVILNEASEFDNSDQYSYYGTHPQK